MPNRLFVALAVTAGIVATTVACADELPNTALVEEGPLPDDLVTTTVPTTLPPNDLGPPALSDTSTVSTVGIDAITFGMTLDQAQEAAGSYFSRVDAAQADACYDAEALEGPAGLAFTVENGTVEALTVAEPGVTTRSGAGVGSSIPELQALFGDRLRVTEDEDGSTTATFVPTDPEDANYRIIFESSDGTVSAYRSGRLPVVRDGC